MADTALSQRIARLRNMQTGANAKAQPAAPAAEEPGLSLDSLRYPGQQAAQFLKKGLTTMQQGVADAIDSTPALKKLKKLAGDAGRALSEGAGNSTLVPQAIRDSQGLGETLRQAGKK